jgi:peptide subunit release factor 1 (eRF1)
MFTEKSLRDNAHLVKALMGIAAEDFYRMGEGIKKRHFSFSRYCPGCGSNAVEAVEDVVEMAIEQALEQRAALELVRSGVVRRLMSERGPMAALLRG